MPSRSVRAAPELLQDAVAGGRVVHRRGPPPWRGSSAVSPSVLKRATSWATASPDRRPAACAAAVKDRPAATASTALARATRSARSLPARVIWSRRSARSRPGAEPRLLGRAMSASVRSLDRTDARACQAHTRLATLMRTDPPGRAFRSPAHRSFEGLIGGGGRPATGRSRLELLAQHERHNPADQQHRRFREAHAHPPCYLLDPAASGVPTWWRTVRTHECPVKPIERAADSLTRSEPRAMLPSTATRQAHDSTMWPLLGTGSTREGSSMTSILDDGAWGREARDDGRRARLSRRGFLRRACAAWPPCRWPSPASRPQPLPPRRRARRPSRPRSSRPRRRATVQISAPTAAPPRSPPRRPSPRPSQPPGRDGAASWSTATSSPIPRLIPTWPTSR